MKLQNYLSMIEFTPFVDWDYGYKVTFVLHGNVQKCKALKRNSVNSNARHMLD